MLNGLKILVVMETKAAIASPTPALVPADPKPAVGTIQRFSDFESWDEFNRASPEGTAFTESCFLRAYGAPFEFYRVQKGTATLAQFAIFAAKSRDQLPSRDFIPHAGIQFAPSSGSLYDDQSIRFRIKEMLIKEVFSGFQKVSFHMSPSNVDMRAFQWHEYHASNMRLKYRVDIRYTSYLDISSLSGAADPFSSPLFRGFSSVRRNLIRRASRDRFVTSESTDIEILANLHSHPEFFMNEEQVLLMQKISEELLVKGRARLFINRDRFGNAAFAALYLIDSKRAYYLFGAGDPAYQGEVAGAAIQWDIFQSLNKSGIREVDLVGVNSPARGAFKTRFGGKLVPYFSISRG